MRIRRIGQPASILPLDLVKQHLKVETDVDDALIQGIIAGAIDHVDGPRGWLGRALGEQTLEGTLDGGWPLCDRSALRLPYPPVLSIESVTYIDPDGVEQMLPESGYQVIDSGEWSSYLAPAYGMSWPAVRCQEGSVTIQWKAGYATDDVPPSIKAALLLLIGHRYANREAIVTGTISTELPLGVQDLLTPHRVFS